MVSNQVAESFAASAAEFKAAAAGYNFTYQGYSDEWTVDKNTCQVQWHDAAADFLLTNAKGAQLILTVAENPIEGVIYNITSGGVFTASPVSSSTDSETYAGYAIADGSPPTSYPVDYVSAIWYVPWVEQPNDPSGTSPNCHITYSGDPNQCVVETWVGLQNSTYDGPDHLPSGHGEVVQTGSDGNETCTYNSGVGNWQCSASYRGWSEYVRGDSSGNLDVIDGPHYCSTSEGTNDEMVGQVGTTYYFNDTSGYETYTILTDYGSTTTVCSHPFTNGEVHAEYYADYFQERPQLPSGSTVLPEFGTGSGASSTNTVTFYDCGMAVGTLNSEFGAYPNYNSGYGFGSHMYNGGNTDTTVSAWTENSGSTYGYFSDTWDTSAGT